MSEVEGMGLLRASPSVPTCDVADSADRLRTGIQTIRHQIEEWISFDRGQRERQGLLTSPDNHIISPPFWPSHGQLGNWVALFNRVEAALSASGPTGGGWRPIETAPKDGVWFQAWDEKHNWRDRPAVCTVRWDGKRFADHLAFTYGNLTHWQPLPAPPATSPHGDEEGVGG